MIRITRQTDYGIVLLTCFANGSNSLRNARDLAAETGQPLPTVSKILKILARQGLLESQRGVNGGYRLARVATDISVADIITALEGPIAITECLDDSADDCSYEASCPCRPNWERINVAIRSALTGVPLTDMIPRFPLPPLKSIKTAVAANSELTSDTKLASDGVPVEGVSKIPAEGVS
jgi:FeS assembly SUF system regulator